MLEFALGGLAMLTFTPCAASVDGLLSVISWPVWIFHLPGNMLAQGLTNDTTEFWVIIFSTGFLQSFGIILLGTAIYRRRQQTLKGRKP